MQILDIKQYYIIHLLLNSTENNPLTSNRLAEELNLSNKTVQFSISNMNSFCQNNGFEIISKSGNGFYVEIFDSEKALTLKQNLDIYFSKNYIIEDKNALLQANIILYLINRSEPITIDYLCQLFYLSKSTIYSYLGWFKQVAKRSGIDLQIERKSGIIKNAAEENIRLFTAFNIGNNAFQFDFDLIYGEDFQFSKDGFDKSNKIIQCFEKYETVLGDTKFNVFLAYLAYSEYRFKRFYNLYINDAKIRELHNLKEWALAEEIVNTLNLSIRSDENEIAAIAAYLLTFNDSSISLTAERYGEKYYTGISSLYNHINTYLQNLSPELCMVNGFQVQLEHLAYRIYFLYYFNFYDKSLSAIKLNNMQTPNAMSKSLARMITSQITEFFGQRLEHKFADYICSFCHNLLYSSELINEKRELLLILKDGRFYNEYIYSWLYKHLDPQPTSITQMPLYKANIKDLSSYDLILSDYQGLSSLQGKYNVYYITSPIDENCSFLNDYYRSAFLKNMSNSFIHENFKHIFINRDASVFNTADFLTQLDNDLDGLGNIPIRDLRKIIRPINFYGGNKMLIVPYLYKNQNKHKNIFSLYFNNDPKSKYSHLVFFSIYTDFSLNSLLKIRNFCDEIQTNPTFFQEFESEHS